MSSEIKDDDKSKPPKTRGEVSAQEQQRGVQDITDKSKEPKPPKTRGEVSAQEQQRIAEETKK
ncbi:MAG TPA: hypothetical protein VFH25_02060 [Nitrososphaeraceae archaeon]|nr:hypothetical protein [Nitrososphaeraceae archaeon]